MADGQLSSLILIGVCILLSAFFSSSEAAFLALERVRLAHLINTNKPGARRVAAMLEKPERLLSTILLGNNLVNVAFTALITVVALNILGEGREAEAAVVATIAGTALLLIFGEIIPKTIAVHKAENVSFWYARPLQIIELLLLPFVYVLQALTRAVTQTLGISPNADRNSITESELLSLIDIGEAEGAFEPSEAELLQNVFRFGDRQVREVMTPRPEIVGISHNATLSEFLAIYCQHSHTRFPVYKDSQDEIIGILSAKDVLKNMAANGISYNDIVTNEVRTALFMPETKRTAELFEEMRKDGHQMSVIVDEYGGIAGIVTLKRLSEEVVGSHGEEDEIPEEEYESLDENTYQVEAAMSIDEANEELAVNLPDGDFDTLAGFVLDRLGRIPREGETLEHGGVRIEVTEMKGLKIETLKITRLHPDAAPSQHPPAT